MIELTPRAADQIRRMKAEAGAESKCLRLFVETGGCSGSQYGMSFDDAKEGDRSCESAGIRVVVDPSSAPLLEGVAIDFDDGLQGKGFEIRNPNAKSSCGCGRSFS